MERCKEKQAMTMTIKEAASMIGMTPTKLRDTLVIGKVFPEEVATAITRPGNYRITPIIWRKPFEDFVNARKVSK